MNSALAIQPAEAAEDFDWCADLMVASEPWVTLGRDREGAHAALRRPGTTLFVGRVGEQRLGFLLLADYGFAASPYVASIAVDESARGRGVGTALMRWAEERYRHRRYLFLLVSSFNVGAQQLYFRLGYQKAGELPDYVVPGHSEWILWKKLA